jgi:hypothetical protein
MTKQSYYVFPGVEWVAGAPVPANRVVSLTASEASYDLALNRIVLGSSQPPEIPPEAPLVATDTIKIARGNRTLTLTIEALSSYLGGSSGVSLSLSTQSFQSGVSSGAILAAITAPSGWIITAETTFGGRVAVSGSNLVAAMNLAGAANGSARLKATSPNGLETVSKTFDLVMTAPVSGDVTAPTVVSPTAYTVAENSPLTITLQANEAVTWAKTGGADAAAFALSGSTVTFAARDFELPTDAGADNVYNASFSATDSAGNATLFDLAVTVTNVVETLPTLPRPIGAASGLLHALPLALAA